jgi:hypothetical protein
LIRFGAIVAASVLALASIAPAGAAGNNSGAPVPPASVFGVSAASAPSDVRIALFYDPVYVDTAENGSGEAYNLRETLIDQGFAVTTFTGVTTAAWTAALANADVVAIPELENSSALGNDLEPGALAALRSFLSGGGRMTTYVDSAFGFMEVVLDLPPGTLESNEECPCSKTAAAAGTEWASGPDTLDDNNATDTLKISTAPVGSKAIYADDDDTDEAGLAYIPYGSGSIVYFGWDWYFDGTETAQFANWFAVLELTMLASGRAPEPTPTPEPVVVTPNFTG